VDKPARATEASTSKSARHRRGQKLYVANIYSDFISVIEPAH
jgi:DNA-binding beta-propeller fold protein YncE